MDIFFTIGVPVMMAMDDRPPKCAALHGAIAGGGK
jgi:hypothetical protein